MNAVPLMLLVSLPALLAQDNEIGCFVEGECVDSLFLDFSETEDAQGCLEFCQNSLNCNHFTYYSDSNGCFSFLNCNALSESTCDDCLSGESSCPDLR